MIKDVGGRNHRRILKFAVCLCLSGEESNAQNRARNNRECETKKKRTDRLLTTNCHRGGRCVCLNVRVANSLYTLNRQCLCRRGFLALWFSLCDLILIRCVERGSSSVSATGWWLNSGHANKIATKSDGKRKRKIFFLFFKILLSRKR